MTRLAYRLDRLRKRRTDPVSRAVLVNEASLAKALATPGARDALLYISESARPVERIGIVLVFSTIRWDLPRAFDSSDLVGLPVT